MIDCMSLNEAVDAIYNNLDDVDASDIAAFWSRVTYLMNKTQRVNPQDFRHKLEAITVRTLKGIQCSFGVRELAQTALGVSKVITQLGDSRKRHHRGGPREVLHNLLIGFNAKKERLCFNKLRMQPNQSLADLTQDICPT